MVTVIDTTRPEKAKLRHPEKAHKPDNEITKKPDWIRVKAPTSKGYQETREIVKSKGLVTVCEEAGCPNIGECWDKQHATMMIMGDTCTRACSFCNVITGKPAPLDLDEPRRVGLAVAEMGLEHVVITSVDRDDLEDGGAMHFVETINAIRTASPRTTIEILTPDFLRKDGWEARVIDAKPDVFNHNLETVPRLYLSIRPGARYFHSLRLLEKVKERDPSQFTKSGLMVGLGESKEEVMQVMDDMRSAGIDFLKPASGTITGVFEVNRETLDTIRGEVDRLGKNTYHFESELHNADGIAVARVHKEVYVRSRKRAAGKENS